MTSFNNIDPNLGMMPQPSGAVPQGQFPQQPKEENFFSQMGNNISMTGDIANMMLGQVPVVGGVLGAGAELGAEVAALPLKTAGFAGTVSGTVVEGYGNLVDGAHEFVGGGIEKVGGLVEKPGEMITGVTDKVGDTLDKIPVIGGLLGAGVKLQGEIMALPSKAAGGLLKLGGKAVETIGDVVSAPFKAAGKILKKL